MWTLSHSFLSIYWSVSLYFGGGALGTCLFLLPTIGKGRGVGGAPTLRTLGSGTHVPTLVSRIHVIPSRIGGGRQSPAVVGYELYGHTDARFRPVLPSVVF